MTGDHLKRACEAWAAFDQQVAHRTAAKVDPDLLFNVRRDLSHLSGTYQRRGAALVALVRVLDKYDLGTEGVLAPWQLNDPSGRITSRLERTAPLVELIEGFELAVSWEQSGKDFVVKFELV